MGLPLIIRPRLFLCGRARERLMKGLPVIFKLYLRILVHYGIRF